MTATAESKEAIEAARKAYNSLSAEQKALVSKETLKKLTDAEAAYKKLQDDANKKAAEEQEKKQEEVNTLALNAGLKVDQVGKKINVKWGEVKNADGYAIYVAYCGTKFSKTPSKITTKATSTSVTVTKVNGSLKQSGKE